jgi:hypothetical protein
VVAVANVIADHELAVAFGNVVPATVLGVLGVLDAGRGRCGPLDPAAVHRKSCRGLTADKTKTGGDAQGY